MEKSFQFAQWKELEGKSTAEDKLLEDREDSCIGWGHKRGFRTPEALLKNSESVYMLGFPGYWGWDYGEAHGTQS